MIHTKPNKECLPGFWDINENPLIEGGNSKITFQSDSILTIENLLSEDTCDALIDLFEKSNISAPVSVNGLKDENYGIGSKRASGWSESMADQLSPLIITLLSNLNCTESTATDWWQDGKINEWEPVAVSPLLRFMKYEKDSEHYSHYDAGYFYQDNIHRTLKSLVIYLTTNKIGATRFIKDEQGNIPVWDRNHDDWNRRANDSEVLFESFPVKGKALIFDHRLCHDVQQYDGAEGYRIIIRADIIYKPHV